MEMQLSVPRGSRSKKERDCDFAQVVQHNVGKITSGLLNHQLNLISSACSKPGGSPSSVVFGRRSMHSPTGINLDAV